MKKYIIEGGRPLAGEVAISGAKNSVLKLMAASLLAPGKTTLTNVPAISDVLTMAEMLESLGASTTFKDGTMVIDATQEPTIEAPYELVGRMRASFNVLGPLLARRGSARVAMPGGCSIGTRPVDLHERGLTALGAKLTRSHGFIEGNVHNLVGARILLDFPSRGATENILTAATLAEGSTVIENAAREPDIIDLATFLKRMGAEIEGEGTSTITIHGSATLEATSYEVPSDPIEAGTLALAVLATRGSAELVGARADRELEIFIEKLIETGAECRETPNGVHVSIGDRPRPVDFATLPYPGFPTDLQAPMMAYLTTAQGVSIVTENIFESRFLHVDELIRLGAEIRTEGHHAVVRGVPQLDGAPVRATDIRSGAALVVATLGARGISEIHDIHHLERGHESLPSRLSGLGASIETAAA